MNKEHQIILSLLRMAIRAPQGKLGSGIGIGIAAVDWAKVMDVAFEQGVLGVCFEAIERLPKGQQPDLDSLMEWYGQVEYQKNDYRLHKDVISQLARFYAEQGIQMMLLKGYGLSLYWPIPEHRPTGDIDVYFFGKWKQADQLVHDKLDIEIDKSHHHHTCYAYPSTSSGQAHTMVENHYDFINVHAHSDARKIDQKLKELALKAESLELRGERGSEQEDSLSSKLSSLIYLPNADFNALFLIRHLGQHFAGERVTLRQLLDWHIFLQKEGEKVNWTETNQFLKEIGLFDFKEHINHICEYCFQGTLDSLSEIEERILNDVLSPEFCEEGKGVLFKCRRWKANIWKHRLVYNENLLPMFCTLALSHIKKP